MITRELGNYLRHIAGHYPVVTLTGPRQSGKTTLSRAAFPNHTYCNLEDPELRSLAFTDPRAFLKQGTADLIIDEAQYAPHLFSYIQVLADEKKRNGQFILSGSQNFLLMEKISQSLAGRAAILHLLPLSFRELSASSVTINNWEHYAFSGSYPAPLTQNTAPKDFYPFYIQSYLERDVRQLINVTDLERFRNFLVLCASRTGQQVNYSLLGNELGIDSKTTIRWLSVLETSFIIYRLPQFHKNFGKRLVKAPKLYFYDTGLVCFLLGIKSPEDVALHYAKGFLFENLVLSELCKNKLNKGERPSFYYMRDNTGHEIDLITESGNTLTALEIKSTGTIHPDFRKNLLWLQKLIKPNTLHQWVVYAGERTQTVSDTTIVPWTHLPAVD
jgi:predicted AAA+ superfamily ATPase